MTIAGHTTYILEWCARLSNEAGLWPGASMQVYAENGGSKTVPILAGAIKMPYLYATKTATVSCDAISYTINYGNSGDADQINTVLVDDYDETKVTITNTGGGTDNGYAITWDIGTLAAGASGSVTYTVIINTGVASGSEVINNGIIWGDLSEEVTTDNSYSVTSYAKVSPVANFTSNSPQLFCTNITFTDTTTGGATPYTWYWDFGDGNTSTERNPSYHYAAPGTYSVTLNVTDANGCTDSITKQVRVTAAPRIHIEKTASTSGTCPGSDPLTVHIGDNITYCYNVTNTGDVTLTSVSVSDNIYGPVTLGTTTLAPGGTTGGMVTHKVVESDAPSVINIANATGTDPLGGTVNDTDDCTIIVKMPEVELKKSGSPAIVAPGGNVTYTIKYKNTGTVPLHHAVITENYPDGVTFISASPAPDVGNNVWIIGNLSAGESGTIVIKVKVPEQIDLSFTETGSVIGEGVVMVTKDLSTEQKPYSLRNSVTLSCAQLAPESAYATTKVSGVPGTSLGITESGSGIYSSDEILDLETKNKSIILKKSTNAEYKPTSFNFSDSFSVDFTNKWKQDICSRNMEIDAAIHKKISDATYIDDETISRVDKDKSTMNFDSSFNGSMHIGARTKATEISETYIGEFDVSQTIQIAKGPIPTPAPTPTPIWLPCPFNDSQGNTTEDTEPTP